jgi:hypothetical protein
LITLKQAAAFFNTQVFTDSEGLNPFFAQLTPFNDVTRSSEVSRRRIMEVSPETTSPSVVIMQSTGEEFLVSIPVTDVFNGEPIRKKHVLNPVYAEYSYSSPLGILSGTTITQIALNLVTGDTSVPFYFIVVLFQLYLLYPWLQPLAQHRFFVFGALICSLIFAFIPSLWDWHSVPTFFLYLFFLHANFTPLFTSGVSYTDIFGPHSDPKYQPLHILCFL